MKTTVIIKKNRDFTRMYRRAKCKTGPLLGAAASAFSNYMANHFKKQQIV